LTVRAVTEFIRLTRGLDEAHHRPCPRHNLPFTWEALLLRRK